MNNQVLVAVEAALLLLVAVAEAVVMESIRLTNLDFENCTESIKLVPTLQLVPPHRSPSSSSSPPSLATLSLPNMTTQPLLYIQPHATTHRTILAITTATPTSTTTTTTTTSTTKTQLKYKTKPSHKTLIPYATTTSSTTPTTITHTTPTPVKYKTVPAHQKTLDASLLAKKHTTLDEKPKAPQYIEKHKSKKLDKTHEPFMTDKNKFESFSKDPESLSSTTSFVSSTSTSSSTAPPSSIEVTVPPPNHPLHTTLPPPFPTLPLPPLSSPSTTPTPTLKLPGVWERLNFLLGKHIPLELPSEWALMFEKTYLERIRAVNHEMVDKILQAEVDEEEFTDTSNGNDTCHLPEKRLAHLSHLRKVLVLLLLAFPQTAEEVEEVAWNPQITDYIFRPERRAVFDVYGCRQCYVLDASGVCREMFYCKDGEDVYSRTTRRRPVG